MLVELRDAARRRATDCSLSGDAAHRSDSAEPVNDEEEVEEGEKRGSHGAKVKEWPVRVGSEVLKHVENGGKPKVEARVEDGCELQEKDGLELEGSGGRLDVEGELVTACRVANGRGQEERDGGLVIAGEVDVSIIHGNDHEDGEGVVEHDGDEPVGLGEWAIPEPTRDSRCEGSDCRERRVVDVKADVGEGCDDKRSTPRHRDGVPSIPCYREHRQRGEQVLETDHQDERVKVAHDRFCDTLRKSRCRLLREAKIVHHFLLRVNGVLRPPVGRGKLA
mmetsp:Transcript_17417/g.54411  ORF Transcript_17417/g.54411 Transcript_17417/m.54411 type:complete len:278 (-) Transcript_17417:130-963(-)